jgi:hypothetical protein
VYSNLGFAFKESASPCLLQALPPPLAGSGIPQAQPNDAQDVQSLSWGTSQPFRLQFVDGVGAILGPPFQQSADADLSWRWRAKQNSIHPRDAVASSSGRCRNTGSLPHDIIQNLNFEVKGTSKTPRRLMRESWAMNLLWEWKRPSSSRVVWKIGSWKILSQANSALNQI